MELLEEAVEQNLISCSSVPEAIIVTISASTRNFKSSNFNIMNAAFNTIGKIASLSAKHSKPFPLATLKAFVPPSCGKFGDRKMASVLHEMLLCVAQCVTPFQVVSCLVNGTEFEEPNTACRRSKIFRDCRQ